MPIYEYRCDKDHTFEVMQRITDDPVERCEVCGRRVQRVFHPVAVHFKGSGFYNTDYGTRKRQRETAAAGEGSSKDSGAKSDASSNGSGAKDKKSEGTAKTKAESTNK